MAESASSDGDNGQIIYFILTLTREIRDIVLRIDDRDRHKMSRRRFSIELQEACWRYWEMGQHIAAVKFGQRGRVTYESVYAYYQRDLKALGVDDVEMFRHILRCRTQRLWRNQMQRCV